MTSLTTISKFLFLALALAFSSGTATAQPTTSPDDVYASLVLKLEHANAMLGSAKRTLTTTDAQLDTAWTNVRRIEREIHAGSSPIAARRELTSLATNVASIEKRVTTVAATLPPLQVSIKEIGSLALRFRFFDVYRNANVAMSLSDKLLVDAQTSMHSTNDLKGEIERLMTMLSRG